MLLPQLLPLQTVTPGWNDEPPCYYFAAVSFTVFTKITAAIHHMTQTQTRESPELAGADENGHFSLNEREKNNLSGLTAALPY